jgi:hypothetical protein
MDYQIAATYDIDEHAHHTVRWNRNVNTHQYEYYSDKSGYTRSGVDLPNGPAQDLGSETQQKQCIDTNPYCPTEGAMPSDDVPLVIESGGELPARDKHRIIVIGNVMESRAPAGGADIQVESSYRMPDFRRYPCQKKSVGILSPCTLRKGVRTSILQDYSGILVINHSGSWEE